MPVAALRVSGIDRGGKVAAEDHQLALFLQITFDDFDLTDRFGETPAGDVLFVIDGFLITPPALTGPRRQIDKYGVQREQHQADLPRIMEYDEQRKDRTENELQKGIT